MYHHRRCSLYRNNSLRHSRSIIKYRWLYNTPNMFSQQSMFSIIGILRSSNFLNRSTNNKENSMEGFEDEEEGDVVYLSNIIIAVYWGIVRDIFHNYSVPVWILLWLITLFRNFHSWSRGRRHKMFHSCRIRPNCRTKISWIIINCRIIIEYRTNCRVRIRTEF